MSLIIWIISLLAVAGVIVRPFNIGESYWAAGGALLLVVFGLLKPGLALAGIVKGTDVYLFLAGMMLLAETAREAGLFDWVAAHATRLAAGSPLKLFVLVYGVGLVVTAFLSNDATAVVLTPAVAAAVKAAKVQKPLPYLLICAFIANAASFVLPISNPANLVIYGSHLPALGLWLHRYLLPSGIAILVTYAVLRFVLRKDLDQVIEKKILLPELSNGGKVVLSGIIVTVVILLAASASGIQLGLPTVVTGVFVSGIALIFSKKNPLNILKGVSWSVLPLVAGLFVIVKALNSTGLTILIIHFLQRQTARSASGAAFGAGVATAFVCNLVNNLPAGLIAGNVLQAGQAPELLKTAILIGIDLGPNLSVTGSLATILWLVALRREGIKITAWAFLKPGFFVMTIPLLIALLALIFL